MLLDFFLFDVAYANNQHDLSELKVESLEATPFARAMRMSRGEYKGTVMWLDLHNALIYPCLQELFLYWTMVAKAGPASGGEHFVV